MRWLVTGAWLSIGCATMSSAAVVDFNQLDFRIYGLDGGAPAVTNNSDWGAATVHYDIVADVQYFNLDVNGVWLVRNAPLFAYAPAGSTSSVMFSFGLGNDVGVKVDSLSYGFSVTAAPVLATPGSSATAAVSAYQVATGPGSGIPGTPPVAIPRPPKPPEIDITPFLPVDWAFHTSFPNQDSDVNFCVPTAASSSMKWLNSKFSLGINTADIEPGVLGTKFGTTTESGTPGGWAGLKDDYVQSKGWNITTEDVTTLEDVLRRMKLKEDVEINVNTPDPKNPGQFLSHWAALVGISLNADGSYDLILADDLDQEHKGGTELVFVHYDVKTKLFSGNYSWENGTFEGAVSESVPEPASWLSMIAGFAMVGTALRRRAAAA